MNEKLFNEIVKDDYDKFSSLVNKGYFEISEFKDDVSNLANALSILSQVMEELNAIHSNS